MKNLYDVLGIDRRATTEQIRQAYRSKAKTMHPDAGGNAEEFAEIAQAADVLCDAESREAYDSSGKLPGAEAPVDAGAYDLLMSLFAAEVEKTIAALNPNMDVKAMVMTDLSNKALGLAEMRGQMERRIAKLQDAAKRLKVKDVTADRLTPRLLAMAASVSEHLKKIAEDVQRHERAAEILGEYFWDGQVPMGFGQQNYYQGSKFGSPFPPASY